MIKLLPLLLKEDIYGENATVYQRTSIGKLANKVYDNGFRPDINVKLYHKAFYATYTIDSQLRSEMDKYGNITVKFSCPTTNFFFCDWEQFKKTGLSKKLKATKDDFIFKQLDHYKVYYDEDDTDFINKRIKLDTNTSEKTVTTVVNRFFDSLDNVKGFVFTDNKNDQILVTYDAKRITPLAYTEDEGKTWTKVIGKNLEYLTNNIEKTLLDYDIDNYTINKDGTVDVDGDVDLSRKNLSKIPVKFGVVKGDFYINYNKLTSLKNSPRRVDGNFIFYNNKLTSLEGGPEYVGGDYDCAYNLLRSLKGGLKRVTGYFNCSYNKLTSLEEGPEYVGGNYICSDNPLKSLEYFPKTVKGHEIVVPKHFSNKQIKPYIPKEFKGYVYRGMI